MHNVVFVTPNANGLVREEPVGTLLLATILQEAGIDAKILQFHHFGDARNFEAFMDCAVNSILSHEPKVVSFYTRCDSYHISLKLAQRIKQSAKNVYIVFAGPQADLVSTETLTAFPEIDYICCGEGETTVVPFFTSLLSGNPDHSIDGLVFRKNGSICVNPRPELIPDLDTLPAIDYSLLNFRSDEHGSSVRQPFPVDVGRGCPFSCTFCSTKSFWGRKYRLKSADRIIDEIKTIHEKFGTTSFKFEHDMFTLNRNKVIHICKMLKEIGFPITWRCSARIDCLDEELIDVMVDAGMTYLFVGIETGSPRMQKLIHKNLKLEKAYDILAYAAAKGVEITASFIFGLPKETEDDLSQTIALMAKLCTLPKIHLQHHLCTFFSGTEMTKEYISELEQSAIYSDITGDVGVAECNDIITAHPAIFAHFFEYKNEFREKVKYFPKFFDCWVYAQPVYEYIAQNYYKKNLCQMLLDYSAKNKEALVAGESRNSLVQKDQFINSFANDPQFTILKDVYRFILWEKDPNAAPQDVFGFDVRAFLNGTDIADLKPALSIVSYTTNEDGMRNIILHH